MCSRGEYHRLEKLGRGSFATVYRAVHSVTNLEVAIKDISQEKLTLKLQENLESEISILKNHSHRNIVRLYDIERNERHIYIILEYCRGGDLQRFIKNQPGSRLDEATARHFMDHLAAGLKFLNDRNLVHRDIKPQNLLLTENSPRAILKIADFGFARHLEGTSMADTLCGSPLYMAPEILGQNQYNAKADLWSVGAVLFEMVVGRPPFSAQNQVELLRVIKRPLEIPADVTLSTECVSLLQRLLKREPLERISFEDFFQDPFLSRLTTTEDEDHGGDNPRMCVTDEQTRTAHHTQPPPPLQSIEEHPHHHHHNQHQQLSGGAIRGITDSSSLSTTHRWRQSSHDAMEGMGMEGTVGRSDARSSTSTAVSNSNTESVLPFQQHPHKPPHTPTPPITHTQQQQAVTTPSNALPSPRVNPFKTLAASPPGAAALAATRNTSSSSSSSLLSGGRGRGAGGAGQHSEINTLTGGGVLGMPGGDQQGVGGIGSGSMESDGFVIVDALCETQHGDVNATGNNNKVGGGEANTNTQVPPTMIDSLEGALRVLSYVENSTRRAILIASLGDAKAIAGLESQRRRRDVNAVRMDVEDDDTHAPSSPPFAHTAASPQASLLLDALVLYLKALSVVGTAIKALRQVLEVIQAHSSHGPGRGNWVLAAPGPDDETVSTQSVYNRISALRDWLEVHFGVILERAEECQVHAGCEGEQGVAPASAEELLYKHALNLAREGAVKELLGHAADGVELYSQARLTMEAILAEPLLPVEDQRTLEAYVRDFHSRAEELAQAAKLSTVL